MVIFGDGVSGEVHLSEMLTFRPCGIPISSRPNYRETGGSGLLGTFERRKHTLSSIKRNEPLSGLNFPEPDFSPLSE